jgi:hypothetical protein
VTKAIAPEIRFWPRVDKSDPDGCWLWTGPIGSHGYGTFGIGVRLVLTHRFAYEFCVGPIPKGLVIDHLCGVRPCVRPDHLEAVTQRENVLRGSSPMAQQARQTHCKRGHPFDVENTYRSKDGHRSCKKCQQNRDRGRPR